jgi:hypothetical protein
MKKLMACSIVVVCCLSLTGCPNLSTSQSSKDNPQTKGKEGGDHVLKVKTNHDSYTLKQGETTDVKVTVTREPISWDEDVRITFEKLPKGVTVTPVDGKISKASTDGTFTLSAASDAGEVSDQGTVVDAKSGDKTTTHAIRLTIKKK